MAAKYTGLNQSQVEGLIRWASYPAIYNNLSNAELIVLSVYASSDHLTTPQRMFSANDQFSNETTFIEIIGKDHVGFDWYVNQKGDGPAKISKQSQQKQVIQATQNFSVPPGKLIPSNIL